MVALAGGCASAPPGEPEPPAEPQTVSEPEPVPAGEEAPPLLDRTQVRVFDAVNSTTQWFDGFFGVSDVNDEQNADVRRGLLAIGTRWDERDEFDTSLRFRAQFPLPALKRRTRLLLGRGDTDDLVDGSETETINTLPEQFSDFTDDDWLLGVGYRRHEGLRNGFDFSLGVSIRSSQVDPYVRLTYRWNKGWGERWLWRLRPRVFWQEQRGEGASINSILDFAVNATWLLRNRVTLVGDQEINGMRWKNELIAYQSINDSNAMSYRLFGVGETEDEVEVQDYGFDIRYRRRFLREWLFLELSAGVSWPQEFVIEQRQSNIGVGIAFEMQFGDWPGRPQQRLRDEPDDLGAGGSPPTWASVSHCPGPMQQGSC